MEEFESSLKIRVRPSTRFVFAFGKYEIYAGLPEEERKVNEMLRKKKLTPFAKERCGAVEHVYFFGKIDRIKEACKEAEEFPDVILCGVVHKGEIGSAGCFPVEFEE
ncbi:MAG TPA: hypothetical protein ENG66_05205 [Thermococcus sp.]|nr:hypothetical protein [Thermococcus sp.]